MKSFLEIGQEVEKHLLAIMDAALKSGGVSILGSVDHIRKSIHTIPESTDAPEQPETPVVD